MKNKIENLVVQAMPNFMVSLVVAILIFIIAPETLELARLESDVYELVVGAFWVSLLFFTFWYSGLKKASPLIVLFFKIAIEVLREIKKYVFQKNKKRARVDKEDKEQIQREAVYQIN